VTRNQIKKQRKIRNQRLNFGFTLVELMLAILILGLVVTTVLASFNAVFSTTDALESSSHIYGMAKNCLKQMTVDLESMYVIQPPIYRKPEFNDEPSDFRVAGLSKDLSGTGFAQLRFTSRAHLPLENSHRRGITEIVYYVQTKEDGNQVLKRSDNLYPYPEFEEKGADPTLCEHVKSLAFTFFDEEGSENDSWDSESDAFEFATPRAIGIELEIGDETRSHTFKTRVNLPVYRQVIK
jgi:prepilin-type N-terminal cleavage/methylation domain-containing protein